MAMNNTYGYTFYFSYCGEVITFPITPEELKITVSGNNETVNLINEGQVNILKSPKLTDIEFKARFPMRQYTYGRSFVSFQKYWDFFKKLKENKCMFKFYVYRLGDWDFDKLVSIEDMVISEKAEEGDDVIIEFKLKQAKEYKVKTLQTKTASTNTTTTSTSTTTRSTTNNPSASTTTYTVKSGDTLWGIAKKYYGNGAKYTVIYNANKSVLEATAKKYGYASSKGGNVLFPGTKLTIPKG